MSTLLMKRAAMNDPSAAADLFNKSELYSAVCEIAQEIKQPGETIEKARVRAMQTAEGAALMKAYAMAKHAPSPERFAKAKSPPPDMSKATGQIESQARELISKEPTLFKNARLDKMAAARNEIRKRNPELAREEQEQRSAA